MSIEQEIFQRKTLKPETLLPFGFSRRGGVWEYSEEFMDGDFRADITVTDGGAVSGRVIDVAAGEEYLPVHVETRIGAFVGTVRQAYSDILRKIADECFDSEYFIFPQTNRIARLIREKYGESPDFPFSTAPTYGVFRYPENRKWYGLVMDVRRFRITGEKPENAQDSPVVEAINLKAGAEDMDALLSVPGVYPGYHMQRASWISVILDGTVPDATVMELIDKSRSFTVGAGKNRRTGAKDWIVPANPKYYDVEAAFAQNEEITWKQGRGIAAGDTVYMYVAAPVSAIRWRCLVTETGIPRPFYSDKVSMRYVMRIRRTDTYPPDRFTFEKLKTLGVKLIRGPIAAPPAFLEEVAK